MRPHSNSHRPRLEQLEERCTPGSVLDLLADPLPAALGRSLVFPDASEAPGSRLLPGRLSAADPCLPGPSESLTGRDHVSTPTLPPRAPEIDTVFSAAASLSIGWGTRPLAGNEMSVLDSDGEGMQVAFKGRLEGAVTGTPLDPPFMFVRVDGTGNATQLGRFTVDISHVVNTATRTAIGTYELTAANGDKVHADFTGQATPTPTPGVISIVETATITGGTGRFAGATGSFVCERLYDRVAGTTIGDFEGTISWAGP